MPTDLARLEGWDPIRVGGSDPLGLPFSKGIMATSLLVTGMATDQAYAIASRIAAGLSRRTRREISREELSSLAAAAIRRELGAEHADRYRAWRAFRRARRPFVVCLAGASGVGKSTIAARLAMRLGIRRVVSTDGVRAVLRTVVPRAVLPELHVSSYEQADDTQPSSFPLQMRAVSAATLAITERAVVEGESVLVEGVHVLPGFIRDRLAEVGSPAIVAERLLVLSNPDTHAAHLRQRAREQPARKGQRNVDHFAEIRSTHDELCALANRREVAHYDVRDPRCLVQDIVEELTAVMPVSSRVSA